MGRKKKERIVADIDSLNFVKRELKHYTALKEECQKFEHERMSLLQKIGFVTSFYESTSFPVPEMFQHRDCAIFDKALVEDFLEKREVLYLLDHGFWLLDEETREVMEDLYTRNISWEDIIKQRGLSRMTLCRKRNSGLNEMALWIDRYFRWKIEVQYCK